MQKVLYGSLIGAIGLLIGIYATQAETPAVDVSQAPETGAVFNDCDACPEMVVIPPGWFRMGDLNGGGLDGELPVHDVRIDYYFAVGKYEVTFAEWEACVCDRTMTGITGTELEEMRVEPSASMEFYEMTCRQMLISQQMGSLNYKSREHVQVTFVEFLLSDDGLRATQTLEALIILEAA